MSVITPLFTTHYSLLTIHPSPLTTTIRPSEFVVSFDIVRAGTHTGFESRKEGMENKVQRSGYRLKFALIIFKKSVNKFFNNRFMSVNLSTCNPLSQ